MGEIIHFQQPDNPENVEALVATRDAIDACRAIGFDRETWLSAAANVWDELARMEAAGER
jgi:hypothetical protein